MTFMSVNPRKISRTGLIVMDLTDAGTLLSPGWRAAKKQAAVSEPEPDSANGSALWLSINNTLVYGGRGCVVERARNLST